MDPRTTPCVAASADESLSEVHEVGCCVNQRGSAVELSATSVNTLDTDASPDGVEHSSSSELFGLASLLLFYDAYRGFCMKRLYLDLGAALGMAVVLSLSALGQITQAAPRTATIMGTVTDVNGDAIPNATVVLKEVESNDPLTIVTTENGMFEFHDVTPGITYQLSISAKDFGDWTSTPITLNPDQFKIVSGIQLRI